ncbi:MAG: SMC family ATPase [Erysipelotrichaceae bacterium]|nr:SMC family ATPase [Erysipelotrichaceae bacterium]
MKIIKLTMNAFMTYKDKTVIDFEQMMDHGLYLISGPTGSGKTTIFDAITFALYGCASGSNRQQAYFRSDFASAKDETYVEMIFELHQKIYTIKRSPTYMRQGYKTPKQANATLAYDDIIIEGIKEVNHKINQLLGVDVHQFKQIVMIAQGEFTKLIYASSEEREKVLRHIFHSDSLVTFEKLLQEETRKYKEAYQLSYQSLSTRFSLLDLGETFKQDKKDFHPSYIEQSKEENEKLHLTLKQYEQDYNTTKQAYDDLSKDYYQQKQNNQNLIELKKTQNTYQKLITQEDSMIILKQDIDKLKIIEKNQPIIMTYRQTHKEYNDTKESLHKTMTTLDQLTHDMLQIEQDYQQVPILTKQKDDIFLKLNEYKQTKHYQKEYKNLQKQVKDLQLQHDKSIDQLNDQRKKIEKLKHRMDRDQENVDTLPQLQLELQRSEQMVEEKNKTRIAIHDLSQLFDQLTRMQDQHYDLADKYTQKATIYQNLYHKFQQEDENYRRQQAGIMALNLKENDPCPVCGSLHHPHLATLSSHVLSASELEELNIKLEKAQADKEEAYQEVLSQNERINELQGSINALKNQLSIEEELSKQVFIYLLSDITNTIKEEEKTYQKRHTDVNYLKRLEKSLKKDKDTLQQYQDELESIRNNIIQQENQISVNINHIEQLKKQYNHIEDKLDTIIKDYQLQYNTLITDIKQKEDNYHQTKQDISLYDNQQKTLSSKLDTLSIQLQDDTKAYNDFISHNFDNEDNYLHYATKQNQLSTYEKQYQNYYIQKSSLYDQISQLKIKTKDIQMVDLSKEELKLQELETIKDEKFKQYNTLHHRYHKNNEHIHALEKEYQSNQEIFDKYTIYQDLYDYTSGKNSQRLSFERYVLSFYFEHILEYANVELIKMSQGRFTLHRKVVTKGTKQQGLDLSVMDYETGTMRDIQSLSGGESFKAALSLALGLSEMIQSYAGGIELNTLFIDEGFGSLDSESIDKALSVLMELKNDNKVIGIISHVDELKERIPTQIVVEKSTQGSSLHIEVE